MWDFFCNFAGRKMVLGLTTNDQRLTTNDKIQTIKSYTHEQTHFFGRSRRKDS